MIDIIASKDAVTTLLKNSSFSGISGIDVPQNTTGAQAYAAALSKNTINLQFSSWVPASTANVFTTISTKIIAGKGYTASDLNSADVSYQEDEKVHVYSTARG